MTNYHLFNDDAFTHGFESTDQDSVSLGTEFTVTAQSWLTQFRWIRPTNELDGATRQAALYLVDGTRIIEPMNLPYPAAGQWGAVDLPVPYELTPGTRYKVVVWHPRGRYPAMLDWFDGADEFRGPIRLFNVANATNLWQGSYGYSTGMSYPNGSFRSAAYFSDVTITDVNPTGPPATTVTPSSIGSVEAFGSVSVSGSLSVSPAGIASGAAFGTLIATVSAMLAPAAIPSAEAFGSPSVAASLAVSPSGLASAEAFGSPSVASVMLVALTGIGTAETFGVPGALVHPRAAPVGIGSTEAFGLPQVASAVTCVVVGIGSREAFGTPIHRTGDGVLAFRLRDSSAWVPLTGLAKAWSGESWIPARGKRWDGTGWSSL